MTTRNSFSSLVDEQSFRAVTAAILTPTGRGAVATIRIEGLIADSSFASYFRPVNELPLSEQGLQKIVFGRWGADPHRSEDIVICRVGPSAVEIHCHGGDAAVQRIVHDLKVLGCLILSWPEQLAIGMDTVDTECRIALSKATTWRTAEILNEQASGVLRCAFENLLQRCADHANESMAADFFTQSEELLRWSEFGKHLWQPWSIVLTGRPNVGKSSLINRLLGYERAIVFDQPGTTRDVVTAETVLEGWPFVLADTAGVRETSEQIEAAGIASARRRLQAADLRIVLIDLSESPTADDDRLLSEWPDAIVIGHKCDLDGRWGSRLPELAIRASSVTGVGLDELQRRLVSRLVPRIPARGTPIPISKRQAGLLRSARNHAVSGNWKSATRDVSQLLVDSSLEFTL